MYARMTMMNLVSITDARDNLSRLIREASEKGKKYVVLRDSVPEAVMMSYKDYMMKEAEERQLWQLRFDRLTREARKAFRQWAAKRGIDVKKLTEEEMYELVDRL